ncbi:hypothetical protein J1N35_029419 [Gossypium stocksii]|uniref:Uncharacterized protein n=1 Tax=Gossypium stocksii TaxID=47602 RepID=A0A9D3ZTA2_9ROSI|nr:hypothetical protein J1N35_029419 [Gossypium stocksii]
MGSFKLHESNDHEHNIPKAFRATESKKITQAKGFLDEIEKHFTKNNKFEITSLLTSLMFVKYKVANVIQTKCNFFRQKKIVKNQLFKRDPNRMQQ